MTNTSTTHTGLLVTGPGDDIEIDVELIGGRTLRLSADGSELGAWPVEDCHLEEDPERIGSFRITVDGDDAVFTPNDPVSFRSLIQRLEGATALTDADPSGTVETDVATDVRSDEAADDPVAFLFGSSPPPVPAGPIESRDVDEPAADDAEPVATDAEPTDAAPDHVPSVGESAPRPPQGLDLPDDDVVVDGGAGGHSGVDLDLADEEVGGVEAAAVDDVPVADPVDEIFAAQPEPDPVFAEETTYDPVDAGAVVADTEPGAGTGGQSRGRLGGSALDRLSSAISSITSSDPTADEQPYELGPNTVAAEVLSTQRSLRDHQLKDAVRGKRLKIAGGFVVLVAVVALFAFLTPRAIDFIQSYEGGAEPPPTLPVSETTVPTPNTTTVDATEGPDPAPVSTVVEAGGVETVFDRPAPEFVAIWDSIAAPVDEVLEFEANPVLGPFEEQFTPYLSFVGVVEPQGTIEEFSLVVDPSGPANYDRVGIQALGIAIATVDPERSPGGRAALLGELGLNVRQPNLGGIDGSVETGGVVYTLVYDEATTLLTLTVTPAG